jgi:hypothetical protein
MNIEIVYELMYDYWKVNYGQGSWQSQTTFYLYLPWDGNESFEDLIRRNHSEFVNSAETADGLPGSDRNHRIMIRGVRIGGKKSQVIVSVEKQTIYLKKHIVVEV